jgi:hypothetical protein
VGDLSDFERGQMVGARIVGASVTKTVPLFGVSKATVSKVMSAYTNRERRNSRLKSMLTGRYHSTMRRIALKNHRTTAADVTAELNTHLPQKLPDVSFTNATSTAGLQLLNL